MLKVEANFVLFLLASVISLAFLSNYSSAQGATCGNTCGASCSFPVFSSCSVGSSSTLPASQQSGSTTCNLCEQIQTGPFPSGGSLTSTSQATSSPTSSPVTSVNNYNIQNAPWFLTCPLNPANWEPNPTSSVLFVPNPGANQAGDACVSSQGTLDTQLDLPVSIGWSIGQLAYASVGAFSITNPASLELNNYAYSPELQDSSGSAISSSFSVNSYIFQKVPAIAQNDIWTWSATFVDFSGGSPDTQTASGQGFTYTASCSSSGGTGSTGTCSGASFAGSPAKAQNLSLSQTSQAKSSGNAQATNATRKSLPQSLSLSQASQAKSSSSSLPANAMTKLSFNGQGGECIVGDTTCQPVCDSGLVCVGTGTGLGNSGPTKNCGLCAYPGPGCEQFGNCEPPALTTSTTFASCLPPSPLDVSQPLSCTATVTGSSPTGTVSWSSSGSGSFSSVTCTLSGGSCSVTYGQSTPGLIIIRGTYIGDSQNSGSTSPPVSVTFQQTANFACTYKYSYSETTSLSGISNVQIPFDEVKSDTQNPDGSQNIQTNQFLSPIVPYLTFNYMINGLNGQGMYQSYDIFSPLNYYTPTSSIDMLPIDTPGNIYFNYTHFLIPLSPDSFQTPAILQQALTGINTQIGTSNFENLGLATQAAGASPLSGTFTANIENPLSIAALSNDYLFVLSQPAGPGRDYYISVLRMIPKGYYNTTNNDPASMPSVEQTSTNGGSSSIEDCGSSGCSSVNGASSASTQFTQNWSGYWANVISQQNYNTYLIRQIDLGNSVSQGQSRFEPSSFLGTYIDNMRNGQGCTTGSNGNACQDALVFAPLNISVDSNGDVFIAGVLTTNNYVLIGGITAPAAGNFGYWCNINPVIESCNYGAVLEIPDAIASTAPTPSSMLATTGDWSTTSGVPTLQEIAASPDGTELFAGSEQNGSIYKFSTTSSAIDYSGAFSLNFETPDQQNMLNISYYLQNGGLFGIGFNGITMTPDNTTIPNVEASGTSNPANPNGVNDFDLANFHHPLGIYDIDGYLYVLDNWQGAFGESKSCWGGFLSGIFQYIPTDCSNSGGSQFDILMLRVLDSSGANVPVNPALFNDMFSTYSCIGTFTPSAPVGGPPYQINECIQNNAALPPNLGQPDLSCSPSNECRATSTSCTLSSDQGGGSGQQHWCSSVSEIPGLAGSSYYGISKNTESASQLDLITGQYSAAFSNSYPPYGWPLAANISVGTSGSPVNINFCSSPLGSVCTYNPGNLRENGYDGSFLPYAPQLQVLYTNIFAGFSVDYNNSVAILLRQGAKQESGCFLGFLYCTAIRSPYYGGLLLASFSFDNYTSISTGPTQVSCYVDTSAAGDWSGNMCSQLTSAEFSGKNNGIYPPIYSASDPFTYLESLGGTQQVVAGGLGTAPVTQGSGCPNSAGSGCTVITNDGPPKMTIDQPSTSIGWGNTITITVTPTSSEGSGDQLGLTITNLGTMQKVVDLSGQQQISYIICSSQDTCLAPGQYSVEQSDITEGTSAPNPTTVTIKNWPYITLQTPQVSGATEVITATVPTSTDSLSLTVYSGSGTSGPIIYQCNSGQGCAMPSGTWTGTIQYTCGSTSQCNMPAGIYTVVANDGTIPSSSTETLTIQAPTSTAPVQGSAITLSSKISGYVVVPYQYTYSLVQTYSNPSSGVSSNPQYNCPSLQLPGQQTSQATVFSYALTNQQSDSISASVEGGATYLYDLANQGYYMANVTDANLVLPPQILYDIQNDKIFGSIWANSTYCDSPTSGICGSYKQNNQAVLNATTQLQYGVDTYACSGASQQCGSAQLSYQTFYTQPYTGTLYGPQLVPIGSGGNIASDSVPTSGLTRVFSLYKSVALTLAQTTTVVEQEDTISAAGPGGDMISIMIDGSVLAQSTGSASYDLNDPACLQGIALSQAAQAAEALHSTVSPDACLFAGTYQVSAVDSVTGQTASTTLTILPPQLSLQYTVPQQSSTSTLSVPIFDLYKQVVYDTQLSLSLNGTQYCVGASNCGSTAQPLRGYQQIVYVMGDRFNNLVYTPVEADVANPIKVSLNVNTQTDQGSGGNPGNPNMTTITVSGTAGTYNPVTGLFTPLPSSIGGTPQDIYLYYNNDLDFVNFNPLAGGQETLNGEYCAFGTPSTTLNGMTPIDSATCIQSNPVYTGTGASNPSRIPNSATATYAPSYNSMGECNPPTQGLLESQYFDCNVYSAPYSSSDGYSTPGGTQVEGLPSSCPYTGALSNCGQNYAPTSSYANMNACLNDPNGQPDPQNYCQSLNPSVYTQFMSCAENPVNGAPAVSTKPQYCEQTNYATGNGICTSQIGLIQAVPVSSDGTFSTQIYACGSRSDSITAKYYGWPPPEPILVNQIPLAFTANQVNSPACTSSYCAPTTQNEYNYVYAPGYAQEQLQIGLFELNYGNLSLVTLLGTMGVAMILLLWKGLGQKRSVRRRK